MQLEINIPRMIYVDDYHEFYTAERFYQKINKNIKVKEISTAYLGAYTGLVYIGNLKSPENKACIREEKEKARNKQEQGV